MVSVQHVAAQSSPALVGHNLVGGGVVDEVGRLQREEVLASRSNVIYGKQIPTMQALLPIAPADAAQGGRLRKATDSRASRRRTIAHRPAAKDRRRAASLTGRRR